MAKVNIKGPIISSNDQWIYDWFGMEATSPQKVDQEIKNANGEELEVHINSGGGSVFAGSEIYTALKSYEGNVVVKVVGIAASAASVIAMAGTKVLMSPTAQMMIHNVSMSSQGDYRDMQHSADILKNMNESIANSYMFKSGMSKEELLTMMDNETWMTAQQALDHKLIDEIMFENQVKFVASINSSNMLPQEVIEKIRNSIKNPANSQKNEPDFLMQQNKDSNVIQAKLNLLKLGGKVNE
jgi:ATP-dependent Clp endopeptidase proteolytic subunit ClpP